VKEELTDAEQRPNRPPNQGLAHGALNRTAPSREPLSAAIKELIGAGNELAGLIETTEPYEPAPALDRWDAALDTMIELGGAQ